MEKSSLSEVLPKIEAKASLKANLTKGSDDQRPKLYKVQPLVNHMGRTPVRKWAIRDKDGGILSSSAYVGIIDFDKLIFEETDFEGNPTGKWLNLRHLGGWEVLKQ